MQMQRPVYSNILSGNEVGITDSLKTVYSSPYFVCVEGGMGVGGGGGGRVRGIIKRVQYQEMTALKSPK